MLYNVLYIYICYIYITCYIYIYRTETVPFCRMVNFHFPMVEIPFPYISSPKPQSVDLFCFSILMYSINLIPLCKVW